MANTIQGLTVSSDLGLLRLSQRQQMPSLFAARRWQSFGQRLWSRSRAEAIGAVQCMFFSVHL